MTPEEIELQIQAVQQLIEQVRAENQKEGNTKERVANLLTQINQIIAELNERPSGGGDLTLEQARQNGNILEGDVEFDGMIDGVIKSNSESNKEIRFWGDDSIIDIRNTQPSTGTNSKFSSTPSTSSLDVQFFDENLPNGVQKTTLIVQNGLIRVIEENIDDFKGIVGNREFDKQGDRLAFAQMSDIYDNMGDIGTDYVSKVSEDTQEMNAILKTHSVILGANIGTPIAWEFGRKDGVVGYADASGVWHPIAFFGNIYEHNIRGKVLTSTGVSGTYNCDLNAYTRWMLTLTGNTTIGFTNMILDDETVTISMNVTGNYTLNFPTWLRQSPDSYIYDGTKINRIVIEIGKGGTSPSGWYSITKFDS